MLTDDQKRDLVKTTQERQKASFDWMSNSFYSEFEQVFRSYKCEREPQRKPDNPAEVDPEQTSIGMPDIWSTVRRTVARGTAQIPNLRFRGSDENTAELISRTLMYQWDRGGTQRIQKRHFTQAALFGWSVRSWYWDVDEYPRSRRVNPMDPNLDPGTKQQICDTYNLNPQVQAAPGHWAMLMAQLLRENSRANLLPIKYRYRSYEGPRSDFLLIADCFPEPNFQTLQSSNWFIVQRRHNRDWINKFVKRYPESAEGFEELLRKYPKGTNWSAQNNDHTSLRYNLQAAINRIDSATSADSKTNLWTMTEMWCPGTRPSMTIIGEDDCFLHHLAEDEFPYMLDGKIPFTELVLIDDLLCGIGDSVARIMRGIQQLHDRQVNVRWDLVYNLLRPLIGTTDADLFENPDLIKRLKGMRLVKMRSQGDMWVQGEQAAMAAVAVGLNDDSSIERLLQKLTGETNMSMAANVDPSQSRTATGARIMAYNQDVLTKDLVDSFNTTSLSKDAEMMFLLNRSELADAIEFDPSQYHRNFVSGDMFKDRWIKVEPELFQIDGEVTAEVGSTLADDDEAKVSKAMNLWQMANSRPDLINCETARDEVLIAMGKGKELDRWRTPAPPPPQPEMRVSLNVSAKFDELPPNEGTAVLQKAGILPPPQPPMPPGAPGLPPGGPPGPGGPGGPPMLPPPQGPADEPLAAVGALASAMGHPPIHGVLPQ